ncbi:hypothetical protein O6H91_03G051400 [Diphasiastrum complanatum]|uniref:Uncharacterized protein n=2 Tax=Diphasiastrum complanatum TaxID=34168 RepID=A0ACC2E659_DIPCM|nr:hypothetical protein O6H91_03G051400 [Diphasiastrum complanatum]KAJ7561991.1 hypothetical protein O6H91_03G051400 [Diphasiastrum complanatum]
MDDLVARCKHQLAGFRIRELKAVLARLGLPKQGKKQVLMDKILGVFMPQERQDTAIIGFRPETRFPSKHIVTREEAAKVIDDIYRKLRTLGAADLASAGKNEPSRSCSLALSEDEDEDTAWDKANIRCPCGSREHKSALLQCQCGVSQHMDCVVFPDKPAESAASQLPNPFYCDICRVDHGDPFCVTLMQPLLPTKLNMSLQTGEGSNPLQNIEKTFLLTRSDRELLHRPNHDLQVWCVLLNDKVPFRMHWPAHAELRVNGVSVRVCNRPGTQLLGLNGRDEGPGISVCTREGTNRISLSAYDARPFCIGVRIIRRRTVQQVLSLIPSVTEGELIEEALARVRRCFNGGNCQNMDDDDDSDLEVVAECVTLNLRCPISGSRIKIAGRFKPCVHMGCFDLKTFVELNQRARKWQCPICLKNYTLGDLIIDPLFSRITVTLKTYGEDVTEVEMKEGGIWRPKLEGEAKFREPWRLLDGSVFSGDCERKSKEQDSSLRLVKKEEQSPKQLKTSKTGLKRSLENVHIVKPRKVSKFVGSHSLLQKQMNSTALSQSHSATNCNEATALDNDGVIQETCAEYHISSTSEHPPMLPRLSEPACGLQIQNGVQAVNEKDALIPAGETENDHHWSRPIRGSSAFILNQVDPNKMPSVGIFSNRFPMNGSIHSQPPDADLFHGGPVPGQLSSPPDIVGNPMSVALESELMGDTEATVPTPFSGVVYDFFSNNAENLSNAISNHQMSNCEHSEQVASCSQHPSSLVLNLSDALTTVASNSETFNPSNFSQTYPSHEYQDAEEYVTNVPHLKAPLRFLFPSHPVKEITESNIHNDNLLCEEDPGWFSLSLGIGSSYQHLPEKTGSVATVNGGMRPLDLFRSNKRKEDISLTVTEQSPWDWNTHGIDDDGESSE